jgi:hypothetical protein
MHFYPGVVRYDEPDKEPITVFINESTIRKMNPGFAGRPIFVEHVEEVEEGLDELHGKEDGWVIESFFNQADGKHWVKFIVVSERGLSAIQRGFKLSNTYYPKLNNQAGLWNNIPYQSEVTDGEYEHLAIVQVPRYAESVIMTPEEFKNYNEQQTVELKRLANSNENKGDRKMKLNIFKRTKVDNSVDLDGMLVEGPKSKKEILVTKAIEEYDKFLNMNGYANGDHMVKVGDKDEMSVNDLVKKHMDLQNELNEMKAKNAATEDGGEPGKGADDDEELDNSDESVEEDSGIVGDRGGDESLDNEEDDGDEEEKKAKEAAAKKDKVKNELEKKKLAKEKARRLANANLRDMDEEAPTVSLPADQVARGKALYGSGN